MNKTNSDEYGSSYISRQLCKTAVLANRQTAQMGQASVSHLEHFTAQQTAMIDDLSKRWLMLAGSMPGSKDLMNDLADYLIDSGQRTILFWDTLRQAGNIHCEHERSGSPPVLVYDYDIVIDGRKLKRPVNYALVRIKPEDNNPADPNRRPYIIIDPRAGHGAGIGGSKSDSQVGVAMGAGHPVYFVIFFPDPEPEQTLSDVCAAEGDFIRAVSERHPNAPKPVVIGNCQGGWSTILLSASNPDLTGPVVLNGAPMSYWSGKLGQNPMRYFGGLAGGMLPAALLSDLGAGRFDGANLVLNFEMLNPANTWWSKYYNLYRDIDHGVDRFLSFERWWSGFYFMNASEIRWIIENLFVGNRLTRGGVMLDPRTYINLRHIRSPIIVFASFGDNITPPQQALNWIADAYSDTHEIKACGQKIIYLLHNEIGHLGIFVSSRIAKKQHSQIVSTLKYVENLSPGLYEMVVEDKEGEGLDAVYTVSFHSREIEDVLKFDDEREDEEMFAAISKISRMSGEMYDIIINPLLRLWVNPALADLITAAHPLRLRRTLVSNKNPAFAGLNLVADNVRKTRHPVNDNNIFVNMEKMAATWIEYTMKQSRLLTDAMLEMVFLSIYGSPMMVNLGEADRQYETSLKEFDIHRLPQVQLILSRVAKGGFIDAVVRMLVLLASTRHSVRQDRLERSAELMHDREPFSDLSEVERNQIIHDQSVIVDLIPDLAVSTLSILLPDNASRSHAIELVEYVLGPHEDMEEGTLAMLENIRKTLDMKETDLSLSA